MARTPREPIKPFIIAKLAPIMFGALLIFLLSGFPVAFLLVFRGINGDLWVEHLLTSLIDMSEQLELNIDVPQGKLPAPSYDPARQ